jgi:GT2 family glycosyltransferase
VKLLDTVERLNYITSPLHGYLDEHATRPEGPNIGLRGEHLTITFLSFDRVDLSLRLLNSIQSCMPDFAGEVLIFDNGSSESTVGALREFISSRCDLRMRLIRSEANLGVSCGRNRAVAEANGSWVMSLDNDMVFVRDPRRTVQRELAQLGCKFFSFPILSPDQKSHLTFGGHLHVNLAGENLITASSGSAYDNGEILPDVAPMIGTFLFGTCLFETAAFRSVGGYDEALFVGFEDTDLSIRLFRLGLKVGCSGYSFLVHDHPSLGNAYMDYEKIRFSRTHIMASAKHLEMKYGYSFWNTGLMDWLNSKMPDPTLVHVVGVSVSDTSAKDKV